MHPSENFVKCPHCDMYVEVIALNCKIFRCGIYKSTMKQVDPHMRKEECDRISSEDLIYGCGKPFRVDIINGQYLSRVCDYI